jgi:hypothetical protein
VGKTGEYISKREPNKTKNMKPEELFAQVLFIDSPWFVEKIDLNIQNGELNIFIDFERGSEFAY